MTTVHITGRARLGRGFTLLELLIVIAILGVLSSFVVIQLLGPQKQARDTRRQAELKQYQTALEVYASRNNDRYPTTSGNVTALCGTLATTGCPDDPTTTSHYRYLSLSSGSAYVLWATMERKNDSGQTQYFILCSNGKVGMGITAPSSSCTLP